MLDYTDLVDKLNNDSRESRTTKRWVRPVMLMMMFIRTERGGEWLLNLYACRQMILLLCCCTLQLHSILRDLLFKGTWKI